MREVTCHTVEAVEKQPTVNLDDISVIKSIANSGNRKLSKGVVISEMMDMLFIRRHNTALSTVSAQVRRNNSQIIQSEGTDVWGLTDSRSNVDVDTEQYGGSDGSEQVTSWIPPHIVEAVESEYGQRKWRQAISEAVECYMSQSFESLHHVMEVQIDVISETHETPIGSWIATNADDWVVSMDSTDPSDWGDAFQNNVTGNTPFDTKVDWIQEAFETVRQNPYTSVLDVETLLEWEFGLSENEAQNKASELDYDAINAEWYASVIDNVDDDVRDRVDTPTDLAELSGAHVDQLPLISDAPENQLPDTVRSSVSASACSNMMFDAEWTDLTWETRLGVMAGETDNPSLREKHTTQNATERMSQIRSGDNQ